MRETRPKIVVGTPGRVFDMIERNVLQIDDLKTMCLDEADRMLDAGFIKQIQDIYQCLPLTTQIALVSATMSNEVLELTKKLTKNPVRILVKSSALTLEGIRQFYIAVGKQEWKLDTLCDLYETVTVTQAVIFCASKNAVDRLAQGMRERDFTVSGEWLSLFLDEDEGMLTFGSSAIASHSQASTVTSNKRSVKSS